MLLRRIAERDFPSVTAEKGQSNYCYLTEFINNTFPDRGHIGVDVELIFRYLVAP